MRLRRAQVKMGESIIILFIFFILLAFGMMFYAKISKITSEREVEETKGLAVQNLQKEIRYLSEIQCTEAGNVRFDCYDIGKINALSEVIDNNYDYYAQNVFLYSNITFTQVYPTEEEIFLYSAPITEIAGASSFNVPVTLYDPLDDNYNFGFMTIAVYEP